MINLKRTYIPFSSTGSVCYLATFNHNDSILKVSDEKIIEKIANFQELEVSKIIFAGLSPDTQNLDFFKSKLELNDFICLFQKTPPLPKKNSSFQEFVKYSEFIEKFYKKIGNHNFKFLTPVENNESAILFLVSALLYKDETIDIEDLANYLLWEGDSASRNLIREVSTWKEFAFGEKFLTYKFISKALVNENRPEPTVTNENIINTNGITLNLQSFEKPVSGDSTVELKDIPLNLNSFQEGDFVPESIEQEETKEVEIVEKQEGQELVNELLDFAENFDVLEPETDWEDAFPDTGIKVDDNFTLNDNEMYQKGETEMVEEDDSSSIKKSEENFSEYMEDLFTTLSDLKTVPIEDDEFSANREITLDDIEAIEEEKEDSVPFPDVLDLGNIGSDTEFSFGENIPKEDKSKEETKKYMPGETARIKVPEISELEELPLENENELFELDIDPENTFIDRNIKDALTKEVLVDDDPRRSKNKEAKKKDPKPLTIIVTAEKVDTIHPIDETKKNLDTPKDFKAIRLD